MRYFNFFKAEIFSVKFLQRVITRSRVKLIKQRQEIVHPDKPFGNHAVSIQPLRN